mmetsp:Transcript_11723/g.22301  ORF Transcript_11723/g.22301 Transcript_11723/m.22301 type:complete len:389 (+) Transcript_11723:786-1952(+)
MAHLFACCWCMAQFKTTTAGKVPYYIDPELEGLVEIDVHNAIDYLNNRLGPCVLFEPAPITATPVVHIKGTASGCMATIGYNSNPTATRTLMVAGSCTFGTVVHELMHVLGDVHEQERADRDNWVTVLEGNIQPNRLNQFDKMANENNPIESIGDFDYSSVMMYPKDAFVAKKKANSLEIASDKTGEFGSMIDVIGQRIKASTFDIEKLRTAYQCADTAEPAALWVPIEDKPKGFYSIQGPSNGESIPCANPSKCKTQSITAAVTGQAPEDKKRYVGLDVCNKDGTPGNVKKVPLEPNFSFVTSVYCQGPLADMYFACSSDADCDVATAMGYDGTCNNGRCAVPFLNNENACHNDPCENGATCHNVVGTFKCACEEGFSGRTCSSQTV